MWRDYEAMSDEALYSLLQELAETRAGIRREQLMINDVLSRRMYERGQAGPPSAAAVVRANLAEGFSK